ncbi:hypothetical protein [Myxococcus phage Mx1]|nr:hypothetical protein [Myxococcus phage Mx1]
MSPLPTTLEDAHDEIGRLRQQLLKQNESMAKMAEKFELDRRSLKGQVKHERQLAQMGAGASSTIHTLIQHFSDHAVAWWPRDGEDGLIAELKSFLE